MDDDGYYIDLLFFNRRLRRLVVIDLKLRDFKAADKEQMELYLRWLGEYERQDDEDSPIGLVLCASAKRETVEFLQMGKSGLRVAEYLTKLPPSDVSVRKLRKAIDHAKERFRNRLEMKAKK